MSLYTAVHVVLSLVGIGSGLVVLYGLLAGRELNRWTAVFLTTTALTSLTGFGFPFHELLPSQIVGALSLLVLAVAGYARYGRRLTGVWRRTYAAGAVVALYFNVFVLVVQMFMKVPALEAAAPTQSEPPFVATQLVVLVLFLVTGVLGVVSFGRRVHPGANA